MMIPNLLAAAVTALYFLLQFLSVAIALPRCRVSRQKAYCERRPPVTIIRPICGVEPFSLETLGAAFKLDWPVYEIIFCVDDPSDPIVPIMSRLIAENPEITAQLISGREHLSDNPKLNNMAKGWRCAKYDWIVFLDSNVLPPTDYLQRIFLAHEGGHCMISAPPAGVAPSGFWSEVECSLLNAFQARFQYAADSLGFGFAQGKTLFFARRTLENGGFQALSAEPAEDAAATKLLRNTGGKVRLAGPPFPQPLGRKKFREVFDRHVRWARLRRSTFPSLFFPEILVGIWPPILAMTVLLAPLDLSGLSLLLIGTGLMALWYAPELILTYFAGWPLSWRSPFVFLVRDLLLPLIYLTACAGKHVVWKGVAIPAGGRRTARSRFTKLVQRITPSP